LYAQCYELQKLKVPLFIFHEVSIDPYHPYGGQAAAARPCFEQMARITNGACVEFNDKSSQKLRELLGGVAVLVSAGREALANYAEKNPGAAPLLIGRKP
jgi:hypothetical protein